MRYRVRLTSGARRDLLAIGAYIATHSSEARALRVTDQLRERANGLERFPGRGNSVRGVAPEGTDTFREVVEGNYRLVYEVTDDTVIVHLIADGRRDMQALLMRRLMQA